MNEQLVKQVLWETNHHWNNPEHKKNHLEYEIAREEERLKLLKDELRACTSAADYLSCKQEAEGASPSKSIRP